ncbi:MAG: tRNA lysidine(34) synthetase TilS [Pseudolabrys sp.]|nr:tRNA lysidine(34) synthetase TilS [Pseudolabrys sp.]
MKASAPISITETKTLFAGFEKAQALLLAVSGGPDSTALLMLAARWAKGLKGLKAKPKLFAVTVDHGLRKESKGEAAAVGKLAKKFRVPHQVLRWTGAKPTSGIQQAAREARYRLLTGAADKVGATHILTGHTLDDQAETVIMRMARGSGLSGLGAMARRSRLHGFVLVRPLLDVPKARLIATLKAEKIAYAEDPSNIDPKFTRARLRLLMPELARQGLDARRLAILARRLRRADAAIEIEVSRAAGDLTTTSGNPPRIAVDAAKFGRLPAEVALRLLGRLLAATGTEGPVELGKLEALFAALRAVDGQPFRRTLAGALVTAGGGQLTVETAPARRNSGAAEALTTRRRGKARRAKAR